MIGNIIYSLNFVVLVSGLVFLIILLVCKIFEQLMSFHRFFKYIFNVRLNSYLKELDEDSFEKWISEFKERYKEVRNDCV